MDERCDVLIIGGGPAGATAAILLARAGFSVVVLERKTFPRSKVCGEYLSATNLPLLEKLNVADAFRDLAGPEVKRVGLFAGRSILESAMPPSPLASCSSPFAWGRALSRRQLDTLLLAEAARAGARIWQPCKAVSLALPSAQEAAGLHRCRVLDVDTRETREILASIVIAAHGSWDPGELPTQPQRQSPRPGDLLAFKTHFRNSGLAANLMPLLAFPGGYGGMVACEQGLVSLSCCIRRDWLSRVRSGSSLESGEAVLQHVIESCTGVRQALDGAERHGPWLAAGPIRPGIRLKVKAGLFTVGNAAGEAHPAVAEGITMAMQSAWLLSSRLIYWNREGRSSVGLGAAAQSYRRDWLRFFGPRLLTSSALARWAMSPAAVAGAIPLVRRFPTILAWGARLTGKAVQVV